MLSTSAKNDQWIEISKKRMLENVDPYIWYLILVLFKTFDTEKKIDKVFIVAMLLVQQ